MNTATLSGRMARPMILVAALAGLALALAFAVRPAYAGGTADLKEAHVGTNSATDAGDFQCEGDEVPAGQVLWHFILNGLEPGIDAAIPGHFEFQEDGPQDVDSSKWNNDGTTHHFYVYTSGDDTLLGATADIGSSAYNNFNLSHICRGEEQESPSPTPSESESESQSESESESESASGEGSQGGTTATPEESVGDGAFGFGGTNPVSTVLFSLILLASLGSLAYANVRSARSRS